MARLEDDSTRRMHAREIASRVREARALAIERLRSGDLTLDEAFESSDPLLGHVKIVTLVENVPVLGKVKARRILDELGIASDCKMSELDERRREKLLARAAGVEA